MYHIEHAVVEGFWGRYTASASFKPDVNIFIGQNGSGKTTFMDLLQGVLRADFRILAAHDFTNIVIKLAEKDSHRTIKVSRKPSDTPVELVRFQVGTRAFEFPFYAPEMDLQRHFRARPRLAESYEELRRTIAEIVNVGSLSVHRAGFEQVGDEEYPAHRRRSVRPPLDVRLEELLRHLTSYQLALAERSARISNQFQREVLASTLFDERFDTYSPTTVTELDLSQYQEQLTKAYTELGALTKAVSARISKHVNAIQRSITAVLALKATDKKGISVDDIMPLPLLRRSQHIVELLSQTEARKREVFAPIREFLATLRGFIRDKKIEITPAGDFVVERDQRVVNVPQLSSGEKQLLVLLTETLLQRNEPFVFLADEPELSLHIEWQSLIVESIRRLNSNAQIVVATHSPEIAAGWKEHIIDMAEVVRE